MTDNISLTIPLEYHTLDLAATMLRGLADGIYVPMEEVTITKTAAVGFTEVPPGAVRNTGTFNTAVNAPYPPEPIAEQSYSDLDTGPPEGAIIETDPTNLPWDIRIHASSKARLVKSKNWKPKRGVSPALVEAVEAELRAKMGINATSTPAPPVPAPPVPAVALTPPAPPVKSFVEFVQLVQAEKVDGTVLQAVLNKHGVESLPALSQSEHLIPVIAAELLA